MKSILQEIVKHTHSLGISLVKITGEDVSTRISGLKDDKTVVLEGKFKEPITAFNTTFGMPNLDKLNVILNIPEYEKDATISVTTRTNKDGEPILDGIRFVNKDGNFKNDYRFMVTNQINEKLKDIEYPTLKYQVKVTPSVVGLQKLKFQAQANSEKTTFFSRVDNKNLHFSFGDPSTHAGDFVFESNVTGTLTHAWQWPVSAVINILNLSGDKTMEISDSGVMRITVNSGIGDYTYYIPAQTK
jgi:hypothetical protein